MRDGTPFLTDGASMKSLTVLSTILLAGASLFQTLPVSWNRCFFSTSAYAEESWKSEFDEICSKTQDAMLFTTAELRGLVQRCDALKPVIEKLEESHRKVILRRLQMCRDLYLFVLEAKETK
jgi:hypothetical protein